MCSAAGSGFWAESPRKERAEAATPAEVCCSDVGFGACPCRIPAPETKVTRAAIIDQFRQTPIEHLEAGREIAGRLTIHRNAGLADMKDFATRTVLAEWCCPCFVSPCLPIFPPGHIFHVPSVPTACWKRA